MGNQHVAGLRDVESPSGIPAPRLLLARINLAMPPAIGARIDRVVQQVLSGHARRPPPHKLPPVQPSVGSNRHANVVSHQVAKQAM